MSDDLQKFAQQVILSNKNRSVPNLARMDELSPEEREQLVPSDPDQIAIETPNGFVPLGELVKQKQTPDEKPKSKGLRFHIYKDD
jgi:hypothetical protein